MTRKIIGFSPNRIAYFFLIVLSTSFSFGQETHYWFQQHGPTSNFLAGAVTGGVRDNSNIFYNPGAAAFSEGFNLSLQSEALFYQNLYIRNGVGTGINMEHNGFETAPQLFSLSQQFKKRPKWRISFGIFSMTYSNIKLRARNEEFIELFDQNNDPEIYVGSWTYRNRVREDWGGIGITRKISDELGIGLTTFFTSRSYEYVESFDQNIYVKDSANQYEPRRFITYVDNLDGAAAGLLWKLGIAYEFNDYKLGLSITTPRIQVNFISTMFLSSTQYGRFDAQDTAVVLPNYSLYYDKAQSTYKSPWVIDFGIMKNFFETDIYIRIAYHSRVDPYRMVEPTEPSDISSLLASANPGSGNVIMAHKEVVNLGIGWNRNYTKKFGMMAGFRTDFNYLDYDALEGIPGIIPAISTWNIYHLSGGTTVTVLKHRFTLGLTYSHGSEKGIKQLFNLNPPTGDQTIALKSDDASAYFDQISLLIGYIYNF